MVSGLASLTISLSSYKSAGAPSNQPEAAKLIS